MENLEFYAYVSIVSAAILLVFVPQRFADKRLFFVMWLAAVFALSYIVRFENFDRDIAVYAFEMATGSINLTNTYYLKEPIFWFMIKYVFVLTGSEETTFIIIDMLFLFLTFFFLKKMKVPPYVYFSILAFFPFILGFQNIYRQWTSVVLFMAALAYFGARPVTGVIASSISALLHNSTIIFAPSPLLKSKRMIIKVLIIPAAILTVYALSLFSSDKGYLDTGDNIAALYLIIAMIIVAIGVLSLLLFPAETDRTNVVFAIYILFIDVLCWFFFSPGFSERFSISLLIVLYPYLISWCDTLTRSNPIVRILIVVLGFVPILLFSTRSFILLD